MENHRTNLGMGIGVASTLFVGGLAALVAVIVMGDAYRQWPAAVVLSVFGAAILLSAVSGVSLWLHVRAGLAEEQAVRDRETVAKRIDALASEYSALAREPDPNVQYTEARSLYRRTVELLDNHIGVDTCDSLFVETMEPHKAQANRANLQDMGDMTFTEFLRKARDVLHVISGHVRKPSSKVMRVPAGKSGDDQD